MDLYRKALLLGGVLLLSGPLPVSHAQVTTAITPTTGPGNLGTVVTPAGSVYTITGGTRPGGGLNLFHSFGLFSVGAGDTANFFNNTGLATTNILSRVTGGDPSNIFGTIQTTGFPGAHLYLLNPAGVIFGPGARLNVEGSFHVSTADYLQFTTGEKFFVDPANANTVLSVSPVASFGFLSPHPEAIAIQGSLLEVPAGQALSVVGGDVTINQGAILNASNGGTILIQGGRLRIDSGQILALNAGSGQSSDVQVTGDSLELSHGGKVSTSTIGSGAGGAISVSIAGSISVDGMGSGLFSRTIQNGAAGSVTVTARRLDMTGGAQINTSADGAFGTNGPGGPVTVNAATISLKGAGTGLFSNVRAGAGLGGDISVNAGTLTLTGGARIDSSTGHETIVPGVGTIRSGFGPGGNVTITASDSVVLSDGATISANSVAFGRAGNIVIQAGDSFIARDSSVTTEALHADGGDITLHVAGRLVQLINSEITTHAAGNGGNITIDPQFIIADASKIIASAGVNGGNITLVASQGIFISPDSIIDASGTLGVSGTINISSPTTNLSGTLAPLPKEFLQAGSLLSSRCAARLSGKVGTFVLAGRDGLPPKPGDLMSSPLVLHQSRSSSADRQEESKQGLQISRSTRWNGNDEKFGVKLASAPRGLGGNALEGGCH